MSATARTQAGRAPRRRADDQQAQDAHGPQARDRRPGLLAAAERRQEGLGDARADPGRDDRGQDRHDRELRRRLVRRLDEGVHGRRLGRLPGRVQADEDRVPGRAGRGRHLPRRDLEDLHAVAAEVSTRCPRRTAATAPARTSSRRRRPGAGTGTRRRRATVAPPHGDGRAARDRRRRDGRTAPQQDAPPRGPTPPAAGHATARRRTRRRRRDPGADRQVAVRPHRLPGTRRGRRAEHATRLRRTAP